LRFQFLTARQRHLKRIPPGFESAEAKAMERRRRAVLKTMEEMTVLDMAGGVAED
jgi:hypothetical protein